MMKRLAVLAVVLAVTSFAGAGVIDVVTTGPGSLGHAGTSGDPLQIGETIGIKLVMNFNATTAGLPAGTRAGYLLSSMNVGLGVSGAGTLDAGTKDTYGDPVWQKNASWSLFGITDDGDISNGLDRIAAGALSPIFPATAGAITDLMWDLIITANGGASVTLNLGIVSVGEYAPWRASDNVTPVPGWSQLTNSDLGDLILYQEVPEPMTLALLGIGGLLLRRRVKK